MNMTQIHYPPWVEQTPAAAAATAPQVPPGFGVQTPAATAVPTTGRSDSGWSAWGAFARCPRYFALHDRQPPEGMSLPTGRRDKRGLGTVIHAALASHYLLRMGRPAPDPEDAITQEVQRIGLSDEIDATARACYHGYALQYAGERATPVMVEREQECWFVRYEDGSVCRERTKPAWAVVQTSPRPQVWRSDPGGPDGGRRLAARYTARVDAAFVLPDGKRWNVDHKTGAVINDGTVLRYSMHGQIHGLHHVGAATWGDDFGGVCLNLIQTRAPKYARKTPLAAPRLIADFPRLIVGLAHWIEQMDRAWGVDPMCWPTASHELVCVHTYGVCDYAALCRRGY